MKFVFNNNPNINVIKTMGDLNFLDKTRLLTPQLQEDLSSGQVIEINVGVDLRKINMAIAFNQDLNRWLIVFFIEIIEKKK